MTGNDRNTQVEETSQLDLMTLILQIRKEMEMLKKKKEEEFQQMKRKIEEEIEMLRRENDQINKLNKITYPYFCYSLPFHDMIHCACGISHFVLT